MQETRKRSNSDSQPNLKRRKQQFVQHKSTNPVNSEGISECFHKFTTSLYVSLAPSYLKQPLEGVKSQHLDPMLMKHFQPAGGVVIGYDNLRLSGEHITEAGSVVAKVNAHSPFAFLWVSVDLLLWKPQVGDVLEGHIYMQSPSHIGLLVNDTFNASIKKNNIPEGWSFVPNQADEVQADEEEGTETKKSKSLGQWYDESEIAVDGKLKFTVKAIHNSGRVVSVEGSLVKPGSESESKPVVPNKKIKFDDADLSAAVVEEDEEKKDEVIPVYQANSDEEVIAESDSSDESDSDSD
ncbi:CYFA0S02e09164g1_1 [Cyberlindnera fabianii]|uniref:DNA-directed RNA polymerase subunit n=1 Tax=Cyberlindnera fabianii TaxID=36022 RepID=A0A061AP78_CYBFA|nr:DNA-directed RNA polymerase I subunit RPA43 [Cyberlindnera fabianii]CDR38944.1 CYFA0S02e09164g1_1 [Cyberlindnera fabianii]